MSRSLVVTTWFPDRLNPSRTPFCLAHVHALLEAGVEVTVVHVQLGAAGPPVVEDYDGVRVERIGLRVSRPPSWLATTRIVRRGLATADVLHTMAFSSLLVALGAWLTRRRPWIHTEHWNGVVNPRSVAGWWPRLAFLRRLLALPHLVTGVTGGLAEEMARFARPDGVRVVPCVVEPPARLVPFPSSPPLRLVAVGLLNERKDPLTAVDTVVWLAEQGVDVHLEWVGDGPLLEVARDRAASRGVGDRVSFVGAVPPSSVPARLSAAHVFFVPSTQENFFTAAAEAIVAGRTAVLLRSGGFVEYCTPDNSVLVDRGTPEDLGRAIISAGNRIPYLTPRSVASTIGDRFSSATVGQRFAELYREVQGCPSRA